MKKYKIAKVLGTLATIGGVICTLVGEWASAKEMEETIDEKVREALAASKE